jgi:UPF0716 protein FxsA
MGGGFLICEATMIRLWPIGLILLGFPLLELWVAVWVAREIGWWLLVWLIADVFVGIALIREERFAVFGRVMSAMQQGGDPARAVLASGRLMLAGVLLILPGLITDAVALLILIWPRRRVPPTPASDIIEGECRREDG